MVETVILMYSIWPKLKLRVPTYTLGRIRRIWGKVANCALSYIRPLKSITDRYTSLKQDLLLYHANSAIRYKTT